MGSTKNVFSHFFNLLFKKCLLQNGINYVFQLKMMILVNLTLKNASFRLLVEFTDNPKSVEMRGLIKYRSNASHDIKKSVKELCQIAQIH